MQPEAVSGQSFPSLKNLCLQKIQHCSLEQFKKRFPNLPLELDSIITQNSISELLLPLSKITSITREEHDTHFCSCPDTILLKNKKLMLTGLINNCVIIPQKIRTQTKYFDLERKTKVSEEECNLSDTQNNVEKIIWNVTRKGNVLTLQLTNATIETKTIPLSEQWQLIFWDNNTISGLEKRGNKLFLLFYDLKPLTTLSLKLGQLHNYKEALLLKAIVNVPSGYFFDLKDPYYGDIYNSMPDDIKAIIKSSCRTKQEESLGSTKGK